MPEHADLIGKIYDCAANPDLWTQTLIGVRDRLDGAYAVMLHADLTVEKSDAHGLIIRGIGPSPQFSAQMAARSQEIPGAQKLFRLDTDQAWIQMQQCSEDEFRATSFYREVVAPLNLRDSMNVSFLRRPTAMGTFTVLSEDRRALFNDADAAVMVSLSPHIRRAALINEMLAGQQRQLALLRNLLGVVPTAILLVGRGHQITFANGAAEKLLSEAKILMRKNGALAASMNGESKLALDDAIARASKGDEALGIKGIGVPLLSTGGERAAAYVLPIVGSEVRSEMGLGHCAVFIAERGEQMPVMIEFLRTLFDMTAQEARIAALIAKGDTPDDIATALDLSIHTVRSHVAAAIGKARVKNITQLAVRVNDVVPPVIT